MRKAGGTSLRKYLVEYSSINKIPIQIDEGYTIDTQRLSRKTSQELAVTCLRDPIERIKSSYRFEGRWEQHDKNVSIDTMKPFSIWAAKNRFNNDNNFVWVCTENYYIKALIGYPKFGQNKIGRRELELAKENLLKFDIVLLTEQLSYLKTSQYLKKKLGIDHPVPMFKYPELPRPEMTDEEFFDQQTLIWLTEVNELDIELYKTACRLFEKRTGRWF